MPRPGTALLRWIHHRHSEQYNELQERIIGCGVGFLGKSAKSWRTVPGLILDRDDAIMFDDFSQREVMQLANQEAGRGRRGWKVRNSKQASRSSEEEKSEDHGSKAVYDAHSILTTETEDESEQEEQSKILEKSVRWADKTGRDLTVTISIESLPYVSTRVVILLLDLDERLFEFVQCEFNTDNRLTVSDVLKQLPSFASIESLALQRFRTLCRPNEEFLNLLPLQSYQIREGEILVASGSSCRPKEVMAAAKALLQQKKLYRAVHKAKLSGRALQRLLSSAELAESLEKERHARSSGDAASEEPNESSLEDPEELRDSALILKVLSRELGEDLVECDFADFSFPAFDVEDDEFSETSGVFDLEDSTEKAGVGWFDELLTRSFDDKKPVDFFAVELPDLQESTHDDSEILTSEHSCDDRLVDAFGSSSHAWCEKDAVVPSFAFSGSHFPFD